VLESLQAVECVRNIAAWGMVVRQDATSTKDRIEALETLCCIEGRWSEAAYVTGQVCDYMQFELMQDTLGIALHPGIKNIVDANL
jgi:hypothetical protein